VDVCRTVVPELETVEGEHHVRCHRWREIAAIDAERRVS